MQIYLENTCGLIAPFEGAYDSPAAAGAGFYVGLNETWKV